MVQIFDVMVGKHRGRSRFRLALHSQQLADLVKSRPRIAGGEKYRQQDPRRHREQNAPASRLRIDGLIQLKVVAGRIVPYSGTGSGRGSPSQECMKTV